MRQRRHETPDNPFVRLHHIARLIYPMKADTSDIRNQPAYGPAEAARYLRLPAATLRTWLVGRAYRRGTLRRRFTR